MKPLIYYPTFEPPNDIWLKFALLYLDTFQPIIPDSQVSFLSDTFRKVLNESDLVHIYQPQYFDGYTASLKAIEEVNKFLDDPHGRSFLFREHNAPAIWRNPATWTFEVCKEKFSHDWVDFCEKNKFGKKTPDGILLSEQLAFLFMTYLGHEIAFKKNAHLITDNDHFDHFTNYTQTSSPEFKQKEEFVRTVIQYKLPKNISSISFDKIIQFRNENRHLIRSFNNEVENLQDKISNGYNKSDFIDSFSYPYANLAAEIAKFGLALGAVPFAFYSLNHANAIIQSFIKESLSGIGATIGGTFGLHKGLKDSKSKRFCKKYLTNLSELY